MRRLQLLIVIAFFGVFLAFTARPASASEGTVELQSTTGQDRRCFASSILKQNFEYSLLVSCRGLIYPPEPDMFAYILWAVSVKDGKPEKLGELGVGKAEFRTSSAFTSLFVTKEPDGQVRSPSDRIVMQGAIQSLGFLEGPPPQPIPEGERIIPTISKEQRKPTATPSGEFLAGLRRAILIFLTALFGLIVVIVAIVTTLRRFRE